MRFLGVPSAAAAAAISGLGVVLNTFWVSFPATAAAAAFLVVASAEDMIDGRLATFGTRKHEMEPFPGALRAASRPI